MATAIRILILCMGVLSAAGLCAADTGDGATAKRARESVRPDAADVRYGEKRPELTQSDPACDRLLDVYLPKTPKPAAGYPCVMFIHGGGFKSGSKRSHGRLNSVCVKLLEHGIAVVSINYYLVRKYAKSKTRDRYKEVRVAAEDAELAMKWIVDHAEKYGFDLERFAVCGSSAGARTCFELAYVRSSRPPKIRAVIDLWGMMVDPGMIRAGTPPSLIIHGDKDKVNYISHAYDIKRRLDELKIPNRMIVMEGKGHSQTGEVVKKYMPDIFEFLRQYWEK
jgi:acetyl esterase/lipase